MKKKFKVLIIIVAIGLLAFASTSVNATFQNPTDITLTSNVWSPGQNLNYNTTYFWRVRGFANNVPGGWADSTFTTQIQAAAVSPSPSPSPSPQPSPTPLAGLLEFDAVYWPV